MRARGSGPRSCFVCEDFGHKKKDCPRHHEVLQKVLEVVPFVPRVELKELETVLVVALKLE
ncbi:hypothetical protein H5410_027471, partial [Solanum commersonii]